MSQAGARRRRRPAPADPNAAAPPRPLAPWVLPLVAGLCFGLGYALTHRLLGLRVDGLVPLGQPFSVKPFPGTSLESLRQRFGADKEPIEAKPDLLDAEQRREQESKARREEEDRRQQERQEAEARSAAPAPAPEPAAPAAPPLPEPAPAPTDPAEPSEPAAPEPAL